MFVSLVELDFPSPELFALMLQVKKLEKKVKKFKQLLRAKAEHNTKLSSRLQMSLERRRRKRSMENIWKRLETFLPNLDQNKMILVNISVFLCLSKYF